MKRLLIIATLFGLAVPAAFAVPPAGQGQGQSGQSAASSAADLCRQQRSTIGMSAFRALYAPTGSPKDAMDACLTRQVQVATTAAKNAAKECKAEQADPSFATASGHGGKSFAEWYGTNANKKNAFGKCVSMKAQEAVAASHASTTNAAKKCKAERSSNRAAFDAAYGTKKNAFGKCVSKLTRQQGSSS